jgi:hypothetical protein
MYVTSGTENHFPCLLQGYPRDPPTLTLIDPVLISNDQLHNLTKLVQEKARQKKGEQMLFEVTSFSPDITVRF